jgi:hypothetical protein
MAVKNAVRMALCIECSPAVQEIPGSIPVCEAVVNGVLFVGMPFMFLMSIIYSIWLVGSPALVGSFAVFLFYPIMVGKSVE